MNKTNLSIKSSQIEDACILYNSISDKKKAIRYLKRFCSKYSLNFKSITKILKGL